MLQSMPSMISEENFKAGSVQQDDPMAGGFQVIQTSVEPKVKREDLLVSPQVALSQAKSVLAVMVAIISFYQK